MKELPHKHILINAATRNLSSYLTAERIKNHITDLAKIIGARIVIAPQVEYSRAPRNRGFTAIAGITTSHISCHHWDDCNPQRLQLDVYSCTKFDHDRLIREVMTFWKIKHGNVLVVDRSVSFGFQVNYSGLIGNTGRNREKGK